MLYHSSSELNSFANSQFSVSFILFISLTNPGIFDRHNVSSIFFRFSSDSRIAFLPLVFIIKCCVLSLIMVKLRRKKEEEKV